MDEGVMDRLYLGIYFYLYRSKQQPLKAKVAMEARRERTRRRKRRGDLSWDKQGKTGQMDKEDKQMLWDSQAEEEEVKP